jgi:hypothetical protein
MVRSLAFVFLLAPRLAAAQPAQEAQPAPPEAQPAPLEPAPSPPGPPPVAPAAPTVAPAPAPVSPATPAVARPEPTPPKPGADFLISARIRLPWVVVAGGDSIVPAALPPFAIGAQVDRFGVGIGFNYLSVKEESEETDYLGYGTTTTTDWLTLFLIGPMFTVRLLETPTGTGQLHLLACLVYGTGGSEREADGDTESGPDIDAIGLHGGILGRAVVIEGFGLEAGVGIDYMSLGVHDKDPEIDLQSSIVQFLGFLGVSFML